jgi:hypothetical protein
MALYFDVVSFYIESSTKMSGTTTTNRKGPFTIDTPKNLQVAVRLGRNTVQSPEP